LTSGVASATEVSEIGRLSSADISRL
jgi:hypothetical protein